MSIDRRITQLRSRLRHASDEFRNLVAEDLVDMKWKTFLMLVQGLFPLVPTLRDASEELGMIQQRRSKEAALERTAGLGRDERIVSEQAYRYSVCECVLRGLEALRWPLAMQAFSNPLQEIIDDKSVKLSVVEFILSCVPGSRSHHVEGPPSARRAPAPRDEEEESGGPQEEVLRMNAPMPMHTEESHNISARSSSSQRSKRTLRSFPDDASASAAAASTSSPRGDARGQAGGALSPRSARPAEDLRASFGSEDGFGSVPDFDSISQVSAGRSAAASISGVAASGGQQEDFATLRRSIQVLQHQNLELTKRLRSTLTSMRARDELENQMDTIMHDLRSSLAELSGIGSSVSQSHNTSNTTESRRSDGGALKPRKTARGQDAGVSTIEEDKVIDSILNDSESSSIGGTANRAPRSSTKPSAKDGALDDKNGESRQMWRFVSAQVDGLYRRWTEARGAVRDCMLAEVDLHPDTVRNFMREKVAPNNASSSRRSPESRSMSSSRAAPASRSSRPATQQEFTTDFSLDSMSISSYGASSNKRPLRSQSHSYTESTMRLGSTPSQLRVHQLLGLCPPNSSNGSDRGGSSESKDLHTSVIELDSHRVAQLQRDLVDFSRQAFLMINAMEMPESADDIESMGRRPQKQQGKNARSDTKEHLSALRAASQRLLLHTACYAPLAPLDVPFPMSNDLSGLEALIDEVRGKAGRGSPPEVMERLIERAQAEQEALVRSLGYAEVHARASMQKDKLFNDKVRSFSSSMKRSLDEFSRDMKALQAEVIRPLLSSIVAAERARLNLEGLSLPTNERKRSSASHSAPVNPLDVLARGYMGGEVSALVNSLRAFGPGVQHLDKSLEDISLLVGSHIPSQLSSLCQ